jgi:hypothetical protein
LWWLVVAVQPVAEAVLVACLRELLELFLVLQLL